MGQTELSEGIDRAADNVFKIVAGKPPKMQGLGMGGNSIPTLFTAKKMKVPGAVAAINGLVNEYTQSCAQVRLRWQLGLGKYLLDKLEESMLDKGIFRLTRCRARLAT